VKRTDVNVIVAIGLAGAMGALARYGIELGGDVGRDGFPWPTLLVNVSGAFAIGVVYTLLETRVRPRPYLRAFLAIGLIGAYTTFSTWTVEEALLVRDGALWIAATYAFATVFAGLFATFGGMAAGRAWPPGARGGHDTRRHR
jgi:CrcB protein